MWVTSSSTRTAPSPIRRRVLSRRSRVAGVGEVGRELLGAQPVPVQEALARRVEAVQHQVPAVGQQVDGLADRALAAGRLQGHGHPLGEALRARRRRSPRRRRRTPHRRCAARPARRRSGARPDSSTRAPRWRSTWAAYCPTSPSPITTPRVPRRRPSPRRPPAAWWPRCTPPGPAAGPRPPAGTRLRRQPDHGRLLGHVQAHVPAPPGAVPAGGRPAVAAEHAVPGLQALDRPPGFQHDAGGLVAGHVRKGQRRLAGDSAACRSGTSAPCPR